MNRRLYGGEPLSAPLLSYSEDLLPLLRTGQDPRGSSDSPLEYLLPRGVLLKRAVILDDRLKTG